MDDTNVTPDAAGIVERLRAYRPTSEWGDPIHHVICDEAAATIAAQAAELQRLREAAGKLALYHQSCGHEGDGSDTLVSDILARTGTTSC